MTPLSHVVKSLEMALRIRQSGASSETFTGYRDFSNQRKNAGRAKARRVLQFLDVCVCCGADAEERHHKDDNPTNNAKENLVPLCGTCHQLAHGKYPRKEGEVGPSTVSYAWRHPA
jgi:hypothetical protein